MAAADANPPLTTGAWTDISPSWFVKGDNNTTIAGGLAIDPVNPATLYWGVGAFNKGTPVTGLFKSSDAGSTWKQIGPFDNAVSVYVDPRNPQHLYANEGVAGSHLGFWISNDGGATWAVPQGFTGLAASTGYFINDIYDMDVDPANFDHLLASSHSPWKWDDSVVHRDAGVLESTDGGISWTIHLPVQGWGAGHSISFL